MSNQDTTRYQLEQRYNDLFGQAGTFTYMDIKDALKSRLNGYTVFKNGTIALLAYAKDISSGERNCFVVCYNENLEETMFHISEYLSNYPENSRFITCGRQFNLAEIGEQNSGILICASAGVSCSDMAAAGSGKELKQMFIAAAKTALLSLNLHGGAVKPFPHRQQPPL